MNFRAMMTFRTVLNSQEQGIKHFDNLSTPHFLIEDTPFKDVTWELPVATVSELSNLESSSKQFCSFSGGAFTELRWENPAAPSPLRELLLCLS